MPRRLKSDPDVLLGRVLKLAAKDIRCMERKARELARNPANMHVLEPEDRKALVQVGEFLRKVSADAAPPDLSKLSDKELTRLQDRLQPKRPTKEVKQET